MSHNTTATLRCTLCYTEFSLEEVEDTERCPECFTEVPPHKIAQDVTLTINWQELRALCIPAMRWYRSASKSAVSDDIIRTLEAILGRLYTHRPDGSGALTLEDEMEEAVTKSEGGAKQLAASSSLDPEDEFDIDEDEDYLNIDIISKPKPPMGNN
jgi:hypothetical protein